MPIELPRYGPNMGHPHKTQDGTHRGKVKRHTKMVAASRRYVSLTQDPRKATGGDVVEGDLPFLRGRGCVLNKDLKRGITLCPEAGGEASFAPCDQGGQIEQEVPPWITLPNAAPEGACSPWSVIVQPHSAAEREPEREPLIKRMGKEGNAAVPIWTTKPPLNLDVVCGQGDGRSFLGHLDKMRLAIDPACEPDPLRG